MSSHHELHQRQESSRQDLIPPADIKYLFSPLELSIAQTQQPSSHTNEGRKATFKLINQATLSSNV